MKNLTRRSFIKTGTMATIGMGMLSDPGYASEASAKNVRIAVIGTGNRGTGHVHNLLTIEGVEIVAVCDLEEIRARNAADLCVKAGRKKPAIYAGDHFAYRNLLDKEKTDAVIIATY